MYQLVSFSLDASMIVLLGAGEFAVDSVDENNKLRIASVTILKSVSLVAWYFCAIKIAVTEEPLMVCLMN